MRREARVKMFSFNPRLAPSNPLLWCATIFALVLPSIVTLVYFVWAAKYESSVQQVAFAASKSVQFLFPAVWVFLVLRSRPVWKTCPGKGLWQGALFGFMVLATMLALYHGVIKSTPAFEEPLGKIAEKIAGLGVDSVGLYAALGVFYAVFHSLLEEYYWRWFVFRQLVGPTSTAMAILISSLGFMAHHVVVLSTYFGWASPFTWVFRYALRLAERFGHGSTATVVRFTGRG